MIRFTIGDSLINYLRSRATPEGLSYNTRLSFKVKVLDFIQDGGPYWTILLDVVTLAPSDTQFDNVVIIKIQQSRSIRSKIVDFSALICDLSDG